MPNKSIPSMLDRALLSGALVAGLLLAGSAVAADYVQTTGSTLTFSGK